MIYFAIFSDMLLIFNLSLFEKNTFGREDGGDPG